jgi:hypothetical protein
MVTRNVVVVTGGRDYASRTFVFAALCELHEKRPITLLVHGGAPGADMFAKEWAERMDVALMEFPADWQKHGRRAGPIRNREMLKKSYPDLVVAFLGGRGTASTVGYAEEMGYPVWRPGQEAIAFDLFTNRVSVVGTRLLHPT